MVEDPEYDGIMQLIFPNLFKESGIEDAPVNQYGINTQQYKRWNEGIGSVREAALDVSYNTWADVKYPSGGVMDVASDQRKHTKGSGQFHEDVIRDVALKTARGLIVLEHFGETGKIELQTALANETSSFLGKIDDTPPF